MDDEQEHPPQGDDSEEVRELLEEVDRGNRSARELVEHVARMGTGGLAQEVDREGEIWNVEVTFLGRMSDVKKLVE